jgi:hypothetical protein
MNPIIHQECVGLSVSTHQNYDEEAGEYPWMTCDCFKVEVVISSTSLKHGICGAAVGFILAFHNEERTKRSMHNSTINSSCSSQVGNLFT